MKTSKKLKRTLAATLALLIVAGYAPVMPFSDNLPDMSLTAYATDIYTSLKPISSDSEDQLTAKQVTFNGHKWYIIEDNSSSATAGTVTLLAADNSFGTSKFSDSNSNAYSSSKINTSLKAMTEKNGSFYSVKDAIAGTDLTDVNVTGAKLYLLSNTEAEQYKFLKFVGAQYDGWWLRSPSELVDEAAIYVDGDYGAIGDRLVDEEIGVRPALRLNLESVIFSSESNNYTFTLKPAHTHNFTYSASSATITAMCSAANCGLTDKKVTLTIAAPTLTTYGGTGSAAATLTGLSDFNTATGKNVAEAEIKYVGREGTTYDESTTAPTNAGKYIAKITVEGKTASVNYEIATASASITANPAASEITYGQTLADSTLTGGTGSVPGTFAWKDSTVAPAVSDSQNTEYDVVFTPTDGNYSTAECKVKLTVNKANSTVTKAPKAKTLTYNGQAQALVTAGKATGGEMQYALGTKDAATGTYSASIPTGTNAGTYYILSFAHFSL